MLSYIKTCCENTSANDKHFGLSSISSYSKLKLILITGMLYCFEFKVQNKKILSGNYP
jgi:hypothetical protein